MGRHCSGLALAAGAGLTGCGVWFLMAAMTPRGFMPAVFELLPLPEGCVEACRACPHRQWSAEHSLLQKWGFLNEVLGAWAGVLEPGVATVELRRWSYRSRTKLALSYGLGGWQWGMEPRGEFVRLGRCPIHQPWINDLAEALLAVLPGPEELPLRYWVQNGGQCTLVAKMAPAAAEAVLPRLRNLVENLRLPPELCGLWLHAHPASGRRLFAKGGWFLIRGEAVSLSAAGLRHGPTAFGQAQEELHQQSLDEADRWLGADASSKVLDLYCGVGASLRRWRKQGAQCLGVESSSEAVQCAGFNAPGACLLLGFCATRLPQIRRWAVETSGEALAYVNPPRMGLEPEVLDYLTQEFRPLRMAYLSCSAGTLARDLRVLCASGWRVAALKAYDFFAQTQHVEVLALLERRPDSRRA